MECTQRLECTQELNGTQREIKSPEQIGFLGICGAKYPVKRGPNKIGRDPHTCDIVLNLNSISRQHAVINVLNGKDFMLMDLDSANKTKLEGKSLPAYIPNPLKNGDTVQFGDVFGIFRLLEEDDELPMTQALDIPDTPIGLKHASRFKNMVTTIPESPDVSDKDDSFIIPSQPKCDQKFKNPNNKFIKPSSKTIAIQPIGTNKIDNIFWSSSRKSSSIHLDDSSSSLNDSAISVRSDNIPVNQNEDIHEMKTQPPLVNNQNASKDPVYSAETQVPPGFDDSLSIHNVDTQYPLLNEHLPHVCKINDQNDMQIDLYTANKENENNIYNAETQLFVKNLETVNKKIDPSIFEVNTQIPAVSDLSEVVNEQKDISVFEANTQLPGILIKENNTSKIKNDNDNELKDTSKDKTVSDDDIILFDDIDSQSFEEDLFSQRLLPEVSLIKDDNINKSITPSPTVKETSIPGKRMNRLNSDSSTDCEDIEIQQSQKVVEKPMAKDEDDVTDCEDNLFEEPPKTINNTSDMANHSPKIDFEDMPTQVLEEDLIDTPNKTVTSNKSTKDVSFEEMPTQVLLEDVSEEQMEFEELPTQILTEDTLKKPVRVEKIQMEHYSEELISPFKIPLKTAVKFKRKDAQKSKDISKPTPQKELLQNDKDDEENFYAATQDVLQDLSSQQECSPEIVFTPRKISNVTKTIQLHSKSSVSKVENNQVEHQLPSESKYVQDKSSGSSDGEDKVNNFVTNLTSSQVRQVIGADTQVSTLKKMPSEPSDGEVTPKKVRPFKLMVTELPNSQEIKTSVSLNSKSLATDSSSESEIEEDLQDGTPILFRKKTKPKNNAKMDLTKKFDTSALPTRVITRIRKPSSKVRDSDEGVQKLSKRMLKPTLLPEQDVEIDNEIIQENLTRLKTKNEKRSLEKSTIIKSDAAKLHNIKESNRKHDSSEDIKDDDDKSKHKKEKNKHRSKSKEKREVSKEKSTLKETRENAKEKNTLTEKRDDAKDRSTSKEQRQDAKGKPLSKEKRKDAKGKSSSKEQRKDAKEKISSKEKREDSTCNDKSKESRDDIDNKDITRSLRTRNKTDVTKDINNFTTNDATLSKTVESILMTSNNSLKSNSTLSDANTSTRTRSFRYKGKSDNKIGKSSEPQEKEVSKRKRGRTRRMDQKVEKEESSPEKEEVRRSRRKRMVKEDSKPDKVSHIKRGGQDQSTVYSVSSESGVDSPRRKRGAIDTTRAPSPKRTRSATGVLSARSTPVTITETQHVLFTAFPCEEVKIKLENLGAVTVSDVRSCSVVVTLQIRRTLKLLCAVGLGRPVVGPAWVQACVDTGTLVDPWSYLLEDSVSEQRFGFNLRSTLLGPRNFLSGCTVSATPAVLPPAQDMQHIVECSGGIWCGDPGRVCRAAESDGPRVVVSCAQDRALWPALSRRGVQLVTTEFILTGVLRQKMLIDQYRLCK